MAISTLRRNILFFAVSALAGVAIALLIMRVWPQLVRAPGAAVGISLPTFTDPPEDPAPEAAAQPTATPPAAADPLLAQSVDGSFAPAVQASAPAVVAVYTQRTVTQRVPTLTIDQFLGAPRERLIQRTQRGLGSGVIVDAQGHIITNEHVIADSSQISVQLADGRTAEAQVVGRDPDTELAVLKISLPDMPVMQLGRSDRVAVGDVVLAIGTPLGLSQTVTHGIVSATGRAQLGVATYENFIQTDAAISVGNSGGALVNTRGELIGINTAVLGKAFGAEGIGVAIPVDLVRGVMREILQNGRVIRGWIGIVPEDIGENEFARLRLPHAGVAIANLYQPSPALEAGLQRGDMIETIDGQPVRSAQDTLTRIAARKPGSTVRLTGMRGTETFTRDLQVVEAPQRRTQ